MPAGGPFQRYAGGADERYFERTRHSLEKGVTVQLTCGANSHLRPPPAGRWSSMTSYSEWANFDAATTRPVSSHTGIMVNESLMCRPSLA